MNGYRSLASHACRECLSPLTGYTLYNAFNLPVRQVMSRKVIDEMLRSVAENRRPIAKIRVTERRGHADLAISNVRTITGPCAGGAANDSNSPKAHRRENCLALVQLSR
jgi:hypothetical protein